MPFSAAMLAIAELLHALGKSPANKVAGPLVHDVDEHWRVVLNGHNESVRYGEHGEIEVPPFHCYIEFNGWPAGLLSPYGGVIAAGALANEPAFVAACKAAMPKRG